MRLHTNDASNKNKVFVEAIIETIPDLSKPRQKFMIFIFVLYLSLRGRYTFLGMQRYGEYCEKTLRLQFEKPFDFFKFNIKICEAHASKDCVIVFDPSFIPKSGKHTANKGKFYSGTAGKALPGLEIGGLGLSDLVNNTAFILEAVATPNKEKLLSQNSSLVEHYVQIFTERKNALKKLSDYVVVDGWFAKSNFITPIIAETGLQIICKFRKDAQLKYLFNGPKTGKRGAPKKYDGKVKPKEIDKEHLKFCYEDDEVLIHQGIVWSVSLKRKVKLAHVAFKDDTGKLTERFALYFSTDTNLDGLRIYRMYKVRFQIEFVFRDAKQFTGLSQCQARSENKLHFHFNTSLSAVNIAKATQHLSQPKEQRKPFSLADIKTENFNELMLNLFLSKFQINHNEEINQKAIEDIRKYGLIAA
jgi:hypothetical protein